MNITATRAEPRPFEEVVIASTLESATGQEALMECIHRLSQERSQLQIQLSQHPWSDREAASRIQAITTELEACWAEVRRGRATRRVRMEEALGVDPASCPKTEDQSPQSAPHQTTQSRASQRKRRLLAYAS